MRYLGSFEVKNNKLLVSDPCYTVGTNGTYIINNAKHGIWEAYIEESPEDKVSKLIAIHENYKDSSLLGDTYLMSPSSELGVDSGQMAIGDMSLFNKENYDKFCEITINSLGGIVDNLACVSSTGWGDGVYPLYIKSINGDVIEIIVDFLLEEEEEEDEY